MFVYFNGSDLTCINLIVKVHIKKFICGDTCILLPILIRKAIIRKREVFRIPRGMQSWFLPRITAVKALSTPMGTEVDLL